MKLYFIKKTISTSLTFLLLLGILFFTSSCKEEKPTNESMAEATRVVDKAFQLLEAGEKEKAKVLFEKFASEDIAEAHFALAYQFTLPSEKRFFHFAEAARLGHQKALPYAIKEALFQPSNWELVNPKIAFELVAAAKEKGDWYANEVASYDLQLIEKCMEAPPLDVEKLLTQYPFIEKKSNPYYIWSLAKEASEGGRFGAPNPTLAFQLVIRGNEVPAEFKDVVESAYTLWKNQKSGFDFCGFIVSNMGIEHCRNVAKEEQKQMLAPLLEGLSKVQQKKLLKAYESAKSFMGKRTYAQSSIKDAVELRQEEAAALKHYRELIQEIKEGVFSTSFTSSFQEADASLNANYRALMEKLDNEFIAEELGFDKDGLKFVQRSWIPHRDASADLFYALAPEKDREFWGAWLTAMRAADLEDVVKGITYFDSGD